MIDPKLGSIVSLKSHPFNIESQDVVISGEALLIPPLMVIMEIVRETKDNYDEKTGQQLTAKGYSQCKCIWYSSKSNQFEEAWIHSRFLKEIEADIVNIPNESIREGSIVTLKTLPLELRKRKASLIFELDNTNQEYRKVSTTALLSFVSPVMHVVQIYEVKKNEIKEPLFDIKTGIQKRILPQWNVKCKWFNSNSDKFSEAILPIEVLRVPAETSDDEIKKIHNSIRHEKYLKGEVEKQITVMKPQRIIHRCGEYFLNGFDYISNKSIETLLSNAASFAELDKYYTNRCPKFNFTPDARIAHDMFAEQILPLVEEARERKSYLRIKYINRNEKISIRTLDNYKIQIAKDGAGADVPYLTGYCNSREEERTFKIERISMVEELALVYSDRNMEI